jgi:hypothetical protein
VKDQNHRPAASTAPESATRRARFTRRQEALTIGWLRALARSANASDTTPTPQRTTDETRSR